MTNELQDEPNSEESSSNSSCASGCILICLLLILFVIFLVVSCAHGGSSDVSEDAADSVSGQSAGTTNSSESSDSTDIVGAIGSALGSNSDLKIKVKEAHTVKDKEGNAVTTVKVKYKNNGNSEVSYSQNDWRGENKKGNRKSPLEFDDSFLSLFGSFNELGEGTLAPGGAVTGNLFFKGSLKKLLFYGNASLLDSISGEPTMSWSIG